jgi:hypothetical protein
MPIMTWQLWLAKDLVTQYRLPWQSATVKLSPGRVAQSMLPLSLLLSTFLTRIFHLARLNSVWLFFYGFA